MGHIKIENFSDLNVGHKIKRLVVDARLVAFLLHKIQ